MDTSKLKDLVAALQSKQSKKFSLLRDEILRLAEEFRFSLTMPVDIRTSQGKADLLALAQKLIEEHGLIEDDEKLPPGNETSFLDDSQKGLSIQDEQTQELIADIEELQVTYSIDEIQKAAKRILEDFENGNDISYELTPLMKSLHALILGKYGVRNTYAVICKVAGDELNYKLHLKIAWYEQAQAIDNLLLPPKGKTNTGQYIAMAIELFTRRFISPNPKVIRFVMVHPEFCHVYIHDVFSIRCWEEKDIFILRVHRLDKPGLMVKDYQVENLISTTLYDTFLKITSDFPHDEF